MKINLLLIICVFFLMGVPQVHAQNDSTEDIDDYFNDDGISKKKSYVKIGTLSLIAGDLPISYERHLFSKFSLEVGVGLLLPYYYNNLFAILDEGFERNSRSYGYSFVVFPKFYYLSKKLEYTYTGLQYRQRNFTENNQRVRFNDYSLNHGFNYNFYSRFIIDCSLGIGFRFIDKDKGTINKSSDMGLIMPFSIKIGYLI